MLETDAGSLAAASDADLARMISSSSPGAHAAEAELYRRFAPRVRLYGRKHLRDGAAADDLAQQVLLVTIERLRAGEVRDLDQIASFVLGTSRMMAVAQRRTARRREMLGEQFRHLALAESTVIDDPPDLDGLARCLAALGERERSVLILTFYAERPGAEIAGALGMSSGAVRVVRHRALSRMRDCLSERNADG